MQSNISISFSVNNFWNKTNWKKTSAAMIARAEGKFYFLRHTRYSGVLVNIDEKKWRLGKDESNRFPPFNLNSYFCQTHLAFDHEIRVPGRWKSNAHFSAARTVRYANIHIPAERDGGEFFRVPNSRRRAPIQATVVCCLHIKPFFQRLSNQRHQQYPQCPSSFFILERHKLCGPRQWDREKPHVDNQGRQIKC